MISLDQVILLEKKVESAVARIQQLKAENDALRSKCNELTNALSAKSEQLSAFANDQSQIEDGIRKALDRLNSIENSVLKAAASVELDETKPQTIQTTFQEMKPVTQQSVSKPVQVQKPVVQEKPLPSESIPQMYMDDPEESVESETDSSSEMITDFSNNVDAIFDNPVGSFTDFEETNADLFQPDEAPEDFNNNSEGQTDLGFDIF